MAATREAGTYSLHVKVKAPTERVAEIKASTRPQVKRVSWFWMISKEIEPGLWDVKVAYEVDPA